MGFFKRKAIEELEENEAKKAAAKKSSFGTISAEMQAKWYREHMRDVRAAGSGFMTTTTIPLPSSSWSGSTTPVYPPPYIPDPYAKITTKEIADAYGMEPHAVIHAAKVLWLMGIKTATEAKALFDEVNDELQK